MSVSKNKLLLHSLKRPDGGIGRRAGLKHQWIHFHPGSIPGLGTGGPRYNAVNQMFIEDFLFATGKLQASFILMRNFILQIKIVIRFHFTIFVY